ncbi:MAG: OmpA family protein [bacterium]|nr:OmpA family protein [bacterium]
MKRLNLFLVLLISICCFCTPVLQAQLEKAYAYKEEMLLISENDLNCSYFISNRIAEDLVIIAAPDQEIAKEDYSDGDLMYINQGSISGINEGDVFLILSCGGEINNPLTLKTLGTIYLKISLAEVTCLYEEQATITLRKGCHPVHVGDILIPFKPGKTLFDLKPNYKMCRLPKGTEEIEGQVVASRVELHYDKFTIGPHDLLSVDLGKEVLSQGDFVLFYKKLREDLPEIIIGVGITINPQNNNSTVKILEAAAQVEIGTRLVILPKTMVRSSKVKGNEDIPLINSANRVDPVAPGSETMDINVYFAINERNVSAKYAAEIKKIKDFIADKTQYNVILRGYSCSIGSLEHNLKLSKERVDNVKARLQKELGLDEKLIESNFYGEKDAPCDNSSEAQRRKNRLVSIQVIAK